MQPLNKLRKLIYILSISCIGLFNLNAYSASFPDEKRPGDDKKAKVKKEKDDTTQYVITNGPSEDLEETPDTTLITFPSHDLYASWNTEAAHPYKFNEAFKEDSVTITLINAGDSNFVMPYKGDLTSLFGWRKYRPHYGTDIKLFTGEQVVAAFDGMVRLAKYYQGYGNCVIIRHNNGLETVYAHLSKISVESGQTVNAGTIIGLGGNTGHSFGSHLHFEIRYLGQALDTQDFIDYEKGILKSNTFVLRKLDVENKYDLRALHTRYKQDVGMTRARARNTKGVKGGKYTAKSSGNYKVKNGDTLDRIAKRNHTTVKALCKKNGLKTTSKLRLGQRIKM